MRGVLFVSEWYLDGKEKIDCQIYFPLLFKMDYPKHVPLSTVLFNSLDSLIPSPLSTVMIKLQSGLKQPEGIAKDTDFVSPAGMATIALENSCNPLAK